MWSANVVISQAEMFIVTFFNIYKVKPNDAPECEVIYYIALRLILAVISDEHRMSSW